MFVLLSFVIFLILAVARIIPIDSPLAVLWVLWTIAFNASGLPIPVIVTTRKA